MMPDMGPIRGALTLMTLFCFLGICWWAYRPGNRSRFEEDGWMAFEDSEKPDVQTETRASTSGGDS